MTKMTCKTFLSFPFQRIRTKIISALSWISITVICYTKVQEFPSQKIKPLITLSRKKESRSKSFFIPNKLKRRAKCFTACSWNEDWRTTILAKQNIITDIVRQQTAKPDVSYVNQKFRWRLKILSIHYLLN